MKTTLTLLIAGLIFLVTPMVASADGRHHDGGEKHYQGWVKSDRYDHRHYYDRHDQRRNHRYDNRRDHRYNQRRNQHAKKQLRRELRETRQELRQVKRQIRHKHRRPHYVHSGGTHPYRANPAVVIGLPHLVFQFDW